MNSNSKLFVIDTNVILHDAECIQNFEENDIAIPIVVFNAEQAFASKALLDDDLKLVTITGQAGSGKALLALECSSRYRQTLLARHVVPLSNRDLGFLPGDVGAKLDPYMQPLYDNLTVINP